MSLKTIQLHVLKLPGTAFSTANRRHIYTVSVELRGGEGGGVDVGSLLNTDLNMFFVKNF